MKYVSRNLVVAGVILCLLGGASLASAASSLDVNAAAAIDGNFGLAVTLDGTQTKAFVMDTTPDGEPIYRAQFKFRQNSWVIDPPQGFTTFRNTLFVGRQDLNPSTKITVMRATLIRTISFGYIVRFGVRKDNSQWQFCGDATLPVATSQVRTIMVELAVASAPGANDGYCALYRNNNLMKSESNIDNDTIRIDRVQLGIMEGAINRGTGTGHIDSFESYRAVNP